MRARLMSAAAIVVLLLTAGASGQQRDTRPAAPAAAAPAMPTGTSTLSGQVVADATGATIGHAAVVLIGARTGVIKVTSSDRAGRFAFGALPADRYTVGASKLPYIGAVAGARRPARPGSPIVLADGAKAENIMIRLPLGASISGTIYDQNGIPTRASVTVRQRVTRNGETELIAVPEGSTSADDLGRYRVHGLVPGEYLVAAVGEGGVVPAGLVRLTDTEVDAALAGRATVMPTPPAGASRATPSYHPGTARVLEAVGVAVNAGDERTQIDVRLESVQASRIEGTVTLADGGPLPRGVLVSMETVAGSSALTSGAGLQVGADGRFGIAGQPPGRYALSARTNVGGTPLAAAAIVETLGGDTATLQLVLRPGLVLTGRVVVAEGTATPPPTLAGQRLQLTGLTAASRSQRVTVMPTTTDGTFRITNVMPGRFAFTGAPFFGASTASVTWGFSTVVIDGVDMTDRAIEITSDTPPKDIVVSITDQWQDISGRVTNAQGQGVSDYTMLLFPVDEAYWIYNSRRHVAATPDSDGHYRLGGPGPALLPAGDYYLAAVTDVTKDEQYDPAFLKSLIPAAIRVSLGAGERKAQHVRVQ